jgi:PIN like domain
MRQGPPDLVFFLDENIDGPELADRLRDGGLQCEQHRAHFAAGTSDVEWIPRVAAKGWLIVTRDGMMRRRRVERETWMRAEALVVIIRGDSMGAADMAMALLAAARRLAGYVAKRRPPMIVHVQRSGDTTVVEGGERRGGPKTKR